MTERRIGIWGKFGMAAGAVLVVGALAPQGLVLPGPIIDAGLAVSSLTEQWNESLVGTEWSVWEIGGWQERNGELTAVLPQGGHTIRLTVETVEGGRVDSLKLVASATGLPAVVLLYASLEEVDVESAVDEVVEYLLDGNFDLKPGRSYTHSGTNFSYTLELAGSQAKILFRAEANSE